VFKFQQKQGVHFVHVDLLSRRRNYSRITVGKPACLFSSQGTTLKIISTSTYTKWTKHIGKIRNAFRCLKTLVRLVTNPQSEYLRWHGAHKNRWVVDSNSVNAFSFNISCKNGFLHLSGRWIIGMNPHYVLHRPNASQAVPVKELLSGVINRQDILI
jgi:hypothetical protein